MTVIVTVCATLHIGHTVHHDPDGVLLSDIKVLTLREGHLTTSRRKAPIPQLRCLGGSAKSKFQPEMVQCVNKGADGGGNAQWECKSEMSTSYRFGYTEVFCEAIDHLRDDVYVLQGSCGLEYTIELTEHEGARGDVYQNTVSDYLVALSMIFIAIMVMFVILFPTRPTVQADGYNYYPSYHYRNSYHDQYRNNDAFMNGYVIGRYRGDHGCNQNRCRDSSPPPYTQTATGFASTRYR